MLYKPAAYVFLVTLTITSLFTTSEAGINMNAGRLEVRRLLNRFIHIALESEVGNLEALVKTANPIMGELLENHLQGAAQDTNFSGRILYVINGYQVEFQTLVNNIEIGQERLRRLSRDKKIPFFNTLRILRRLCQSTGGSLQRVTLTPLLEESEMDENEIDESGFQIEMSVLAVRKVLDHLLLIALEKSCNNLETLSDFAKEALNETSLYNYVFDVAQLNKDDVERYITEFNDTFRRILRSGGVSSRNMPIQAELQNLWRKAQGAIEQDAIEQGAIGRFARLRLHDEIDRSTSGEGSSSTQ